VDKAGVKIGTILGAPSDRVLTREIKAAEIVRIPLSPTIAADAAEGVPASLRWPSSMQVSTVAHAHLKGRPRLDPLRGHKRAHAKRTIRSPRRNGRAVSEGFRDVHIRIAKKAPMSGAGDLTSTTTESSMASNPWRTPSGCRQTSPGPMMNSSKPTVDFTLPFTT